jgi:hypothetical protein
MRLLLGCTMLVAVSSTVLMAQRRTSGSTSAEGEKPAQAVTAADIQALRDALAAQQKQIQELQRALAQRGESAQAAQQTTPAVPAASESAQPAAASQPGGVSAQLVETGSSDQRIRNLERQIKGLGPISFSGDVRLRGEPFFGGPADGSLDRMRGRVRVRFNAVADLGSQFRTGFSLASGDINDPVSANQTMGGFYTRKTIAIDQAFVQFTPKQFKPLTLTGGKFLYPWYNTELVWDKDLNPEGAAQSLAFRINTPVLKRIVLVGFELPFAEVAGTTVNGKRIAQQVTYGGQLQTGWHIAPHVELGAYSAFYDFRGADAIALALVRANSKNPQTPLTGVLPLNTSSPVQDSIYTTTATNVVTIGGTTYATGVASITNAQFASRFGLFDNIVRAEIDTGRARLPLTLIGDYVQNTEACANLASILPAPANTASQTFKQTRSAACDSRQRRGYWAEARIGRLQQKGDFQLGYTRIFIEREAVPGNFNYSELRQGTNVTQHRADAFYQFDRNVQLGFTALVGRPLASTEPWLTRLQFDAVYIF